MHRIAFAGLTALTVASCTPPADTRAPARMSGDSAAPAAARVDSTARAAVARGEVVSPSSAAAAAVATGRPRGAVPARSSADTLRTRRPTLSPGRSKHDATSYASAIAFGRHMLKKWPALPAALPGSILPSRRIVAFYGNPLSKHMGVLGEYPPEQMLAKLDSVTASWREADPSTPVQPALQLIAVVAQASPGKDGMYRLRMDTSLIEKVYGWARARHALLFLDVQVGKSTMQQELPRLMPFLSRPDVHLAMDAEFSMHYAHEGQAPGRKIGQFDAQDVNWVSEQLRKLVVDKKLPPKVLVVHRFTKPMILNASKITLDPRVQIVMDMDGFGPPWQKFESYRDYIDLEPVEYTGFKLFFHVDTKHGNRLLTPAEVLGLEPRPLYIQYQ